MRDCPQSGPMKCHKCGKPGHVKAMCRAGNDEKQQRGGRNLRCSHCKKTGHTVDACFVLYRDKEGAVKLAANSTSDYDAFDDSPSSYTTAWNKRLSVFMPFMCLTFGVIWFKSGEILNVSFMC